MVRSLICFRLALSGFNERSSQCSGSGIGLKAAVIIVQPNPALERTVNGGAARLFHQHSGAVVGRSATTLCGGFQASNSRPARTATGRVRPVTTGCFQVPHFQRLVYGGEPGAGSDPYRPFCDVQHSE